MLLWWTVQELTATLFVGVTEAIGASNRNAKYKLSMRILPPYVHEFFISSTLHLGTGERPRDDLYGVRDAADADVCQHYSTYRRNEIGPNL